MRGTRLWVARIILITLAFVGLVAIEGAARVYFWFRHGVPGHSYGTSRPDPEFGAMPRENSYNSNGSLNNLGFRNSEDVFEPKPAGSLRIITYGGSSTYCHQLFNEQAWPIALQRHLRDLGGAHAKDQVLNGGVIMWSMGHIFAKAKRDIPALHPDIVLIYSGVNELFNAAVVAREGPSMHELVQAHQYGHFAKGLSFNTPFRNVITYKWLRDHVVPALTALRAPSATAPAELTVDPDVMENYLQTTRALVEYLTANGVGVVFVREIYSPVPHLSLPVKHAFSAAGALRATAWGARVIDPSPITEDPANRASPLFHTTGIHFTAAGAERFASFLFSHLFAGG